ncbi:MAG: hypothetical protein JOZ24_01005 [Candidatus Eremiobacteraeota bacterium]|nr:hypothetical protein [Candidatus Eremiobacteraeota bacterium]
MADAGGGTRGSILAGIRDLSIVATAVLFFLGFVYRYNELDWFGFTIDEGAQPPANYLLNGIYVLAAPSNHAYLKAVAVLLVLVLVALWVDRRYLRLRIGTFLDRLPRGVVLAGVIALALFFVRDAVNNAANIGYGEASFVASQADYWRFTFAADGVTALDPVLLAANRAGALRHVGETTDAYLIWINAGPRVHGCGFIVPKRIVTAVRTEAWGAVRPDDPRQRYFACLKANGAGVPASPVPQPSRNGASR